MRGIRQWVTGAAVLAGTAGAAAQGPAPLPGLVAEPPIAAALPGGTVVGSTRAPQTGGVTILTPAAAPPPAPVGPPVAAPVIVAPPARPAMGGVVLPPPVPNGPPVPGCPVPGLGGDCCGPLGAHGPVGQEVYFRFGASFPLGDGLLARGLNNGYTVQGGGRSQLFEPVGDTAWAVDLHLQYQYNNATSEDVVTVRGEPVIVRELHRWGVGVGIGQDMFLSAPGFVGGTWDANFRLGWDVGGRFGTGHVDLNPLFDLDGYRRKQDTFCQPFAGVMASMEMPIGGWTCIAGGRLEWAYTTRVDWIKDDDFHEINALLMVGVRY
jgi:hypothetical protein